MQPNSPQGFTEQLIHTITQQDKIWVALAPEGTRKNAQQIRSGFYHIALGANISIVMFAFDFDFEFDYEQKIIGC